MRLGGVDVSTVDGEALLKNYAIVFQDVVLFADTVMENIRLGKRDATMWRCWRWQRRRSATPLYPSCRTATIP